MRSGSEKASSWHAKQKTPASRETNWGSGSSRRPEDKFPRPRRKDDIRVPADRRPWAEAERIQCGVFSRDTTRGAPLRSLPLPRNHRIYRQHHKQRINRTPVIILRVRQVIHDGKKQKRDDVRRRHNPAISPRVPQPSQRQHSQQRTENNVRRGHRLLVTIAMAEAPGAGPQKDHAPRRHPDIQAAMMVDEIEALVELLRHVRDFAELLIFLPFLFAVRRMISRRPPMPAILIVAKINFQTQATAKGHDLVKDAIVSHHPRSRHNDHCQHSRYPWCEPSRLLLIPAVPHPRA